MNLQQCFFLKINLKNKFKKTKSLHILHCGFKNRASLKPSGPI